MRYELTRQLIGDEGRRKCVYKDHLGFDTIGIGRLVDSRKPGAGLRDSEMELMLRNDIDDRVDALTRALPWFQNLDDARKGVLLNMSFQLGVTGLLGFTTSLRLIREGNYRAAADELMDSKWAKQTPQRAERMARQMETGQWQYAPGA